jgi:hypothetical protein
MRMKPMWVRNSPTPLKFILEKAVRTFERFALAWRPLFRLTGRGQRILINV